MNIDAIGYVGRQPAGGYAGFDADASSGAVLEILQGNAEQASCFFENIRTECVDRVCNNHEPLSALVDECVQACGLSPAGAACAIIENQRIHLATRGSGEVYLIRNGKVVKLLSGDHHAVGDARREDVFVLGTANFFAGMKDVSGELSRIESDNLQEFVTDLSHRLQHVNQTGVAALLIRFTPSAQNAHQKSPATEKNEQQSARKLISISGLKSRRRMISLFGLAVVLAILLWSVVFGYERRRHDKAVAQIAEGKTHITEIMKQAEDAAFLDPTQAQSYINEAQAKYEELKDLYGEKEAVELQELHDFITAKQGEITHSTWRDAEEYYDLTLDTQDARGEQITLADGYAYVLDTKRGAIYALHLEKKSLQTYTNDIIREARIVFAYNQRIFFLSAKGLYEMETQSKAEQIIAADPEWGTIVSAAMFNGNIYLLDSTSGQIYKYVPVEQGFSAKQSYFKESSLSGGQMDMAIDGAVYISSDTRIKKYIGGEPQDFDGAMPADDANVTRLLTDPDAERVYVWDKARSGIYVYQTSGAFMEQVYSEILGKAESVIVFDQVAYVVSGSVIYQVPLRN